MKMELSSPADIENAAELFLRNINVAAEYSMLGQLPCSPPSPTQPLLKPEVLDLVRYKRALRRRYMRSRNPLDLRDFRWAAYELRKLLFDNKSKYFLDLLRNADPNKKNGFNLWKATRCVKRQPLMRIPIMRPDNTWCRSDAEIASTFADELEGRFTPFALASPSEVQDTETFLNAGLENISGKIVGKQVSRVEQQVLEALKNKQYSSAVFLDIQQAFDRVWHDGLLFKLESLLTSAQYLLLRSYLLGRSFMFVHIVHRGLARNTPLATYADDSVFLANSTTAWRAAAVTQKFLDGFSTWANRWNICVNRSKS
ncbi:GH19634 [Drosophila grimshawi]|uniref:GH19634 n=1 Tax=Drosophila grimshawi TaxID=7222 RepID=B4K081_DROGR|nr:GH19634 [Drosophila grimshawi]